MNGYITHESQLAEAVLIRWQIISLIVIKLPWKNESKSLDVTVGEC